MMRSIFSGVILAGLSLLQWGMGPGPGTPHAAGAPVQPSLRGTNIGTSSSSNTLTLSFPAGSLAGDFAVLATGTQWCSSTPSGWTQDTTNGGPFWCGADYYKTLTSGDITTGSVTITYTGTAAQVAAIAVFVGATSGIRGSPSVSFWYAGGPDTTNTLTTTATPAATDSALYFCSDRSNGTNTSNLGTLQQTANNGSDAAGSLYFQQLSSAGNFSQTCNWPGVQNSKGVFQLIVLVH